MLRQCILVNLVGPKTKWLMIWKMKFEKKKNNEIDKKKKLLTQLLA